MLKRWFQRRRRLSDAQLGREYRVDDVIEQRYEVQQVRRGYMGVVYIAYDRQRRRRVVLKTYQTKYIWDEAAIRRFNAEAELWIRLGSHPNIVCAYDIHTYMGRPHVVAEYVHGGPLRALVGRISPQEAVDYGIQICRGMQHAVERLNLVHRDLKPDNIMISFDGRAKVTDFGLSKVLRPWQTLFDAVPVEMQSRASVRAAFSTSGLGGTLPYMAPELFNGAAASVWSDIYAFGVTLYELFVGRLPFDAQRDDTLIRLIRSAPPPDPRLLAPNTPPDAAAIVMRCLAKRPVERFQSFAELETALQQVREALVGSPFPCESAFDDRDEAEHWKERGLAHMNMGEYKEAIRCFKRTVELDQDQPDGWNLIARCSLQLWLYHEALQAVDEGLRRAVSRTEFAHLYGARGDIFATMQKPVDALAAYDKALSYTPTAPALWRSKGVLLQRLGEMAQAQEYLEKAIQLDPSDAVARRHLGDVLCAGGRHKSAANSYAEALKLDPRSVDGWVRYGNCLLHLARLEEAKHAFEKALQIDPESSEARAGLQRVKK
ncbi:MAG: protein kinase [Roseiflexus castenholzii]|uniref:serine/threonine-protein kinase n=1 Tax=Roseiflexus castenholzii TaxID=120962 RepID=UPI000CC7B2A7|nr:MAG: protein kinase [Roseiflexus castenholzii]